MLQDKSPVKLKNESINEQPPANLYTIKNFTQGTVREQSAKEASKLVHPEISAKRYLVKSVPGKRDHNISNMPSQMNVDAKTTNAMNSKRKSEVDLVSERVAKTKNEVKQLQAELEKLIAQGINKIDHSETKQNVISTENKTGSEVAIDANKTNPDVDVIKAKSFKDSIADIIGGETADAPANHPRVSIRRKYKSPPKQPAQEVVKKVRHYDKTEAQEYIKKQRERHRQFLKNQKKEETFTKDMKNQRLQELRRKSFELVTKNIKQKRARSRSRETVHQPDNIIVEECQSEAANFSLPAEEAVNSNLVPKEAEAKQEPSSSRKRSLRFAHPHLQNITVRPHFENSSAIPALKIPPPRISNLERQHEAAVRIQTMFRGYRQRKLFQEMKNETKVAKRGIPSWLQAAPAMPYPFNFINAVRRKLNSAVQQIANGTSDAAVQSSGPPFNELKENEFQNKSKNESNDKSNSEITNKSKNQIKDNSKNEYNKSKNENDKSNNKITSNAKNEIRDKSKTDLKSFLSHKCLELDGKAVEPLVLSKKSEKESIRTKSATRNGFASDSDTSKNIPEISSESSTFTTNQDPHSSKRPHSSDTDHQDNRLLTINMDRVKKLKLRQPKRLNFSIADLQSSNVSNGTELLQNEVISEHLENSGQSQSSLKDNTSHKEPKSRSMEKHLSGRDSIIASNKCDYIRSNSIPTNISTELISNSNLTESKSQSPVQLQPLKMNSDAMKNNEPDSLHSFRTYMKDFLDGQQEIKTKTESKSLKNSKSSEKIENKENIENSQSTIKTTTSIDKSADVSRRSNSGQVSSGRTESFQEKNNSVEKPTEYSSNFASIASTAPSLRRPSVSLRSSFQVSSSEDTDVAGSGNITNITLRPGQKSTIERKVKSNEIHLKFEAELHLLNEFNDSLRQVMAVEKSLLELHNAKNVMENKATATYHTRDTQTSFMTKTSTDTKITTESQSVPEVISASKMQVHAPSVNYSRGSDITEVLDLPSFNNSIVDANDGSLATTGLELSQIKENSLISSMEESNVDVSVSVVKENCNGNIHAGLSLDMFEQLIKDEDARIENLKTILKIREKTLVDRTKGELAWLEIQKKHLRDSGQLQEISAIKKKQRGLLIKLEHERHEMQRLKQMQKAASKERKSVLREQRNMIKAQLSTTSMITKIKRNTREERRQSGPLKVYNIKSHSESIRSETSMSRRSSANEEVVSVVSHSQSVISHVTEEIVSAEAVPQKSSAIATITSSPQIKTDSVKRSLLMREAALQKRRKAAEELLQWHQRLVEEEGKITELELAASAIINQIPAAADGMGLDEPAAEKHKFKGSHLNLLWRNMTGREEKKFNDQVTYSMSKTTLERFCKDAKRYALGRSRSSTKQSAKHSDSASYISENIAIELSQDSRSWKSKSLSSIQTEIGSNGGDSSRVGTGSRLVTEADTNRNDSQVASYASDFESVPNESSASQVTEKIATNLSTSGKNYTEISEMSSHEQSIMDESQHNGDTSVSEDEDDINTVTEMSKSKKNASNSSKLTEIIDDTSVSTKLSPSENITASKMTNADSITEIIDEKSSSKKSSFVSHSNKISENIKSQHLSLDSIHSQDSTSSIQVLESNNKENITSEISASKTTKNELAVNTENQSLLSKNINSQVTASDSEIHTKNQSLLDKNLDSQHTTNELKIHTENQSLLNKNLLNSQLTTNDSEHRTENQSLLNKNLLDSQHTTNDSEIHTENQSLLDENLDSQRSTNDSDIHTENLSLPNKNLNSQRTTNNSEIPTENQSLLDKNLLDSQHTTNDSEIHTENQSLLDKNLDSQNTTNDSEIHTKNLSLPNKNLNSQRTTNNSEIPTENQSLLDKNLLDSQHTTNDSEIHTENQSLLDKNLDSQNTTNDSEIHTKNLSLLNKNLDSQRTTNDSEIPNEKQSLLNKDLLDSQRATNDSQTDTENQNLLNKNVDSQHTSLHTNEIQTEDRSSKTNTSKNAEEIIESLSIPTSVKTDLDESSQVEENDLIHTKQSSGQSRNSITINAESEVDEVQTRQSDLSENEDQLSGKTDELASQTIDRISEAQLLSEKPTEHYSKTDEDRHVSDADTTVNEEQLPSDKHTGQPYSKTDEDRRVSDEDTTINEELSTDKSFTSADIANEEKEIGTVESNHEDSPISFSNGDSVVEEIDFPDKSVFIEDKNLLNIGENKTEAVTDITEQESTTNKKTESPLDLSYGFIETKKPVDDQNRLNDSGNSEEIVTDTSTSYNLEPQFVMKNEKPEDLPQNQKVKSSTSENVEVQSEREDEKSQTSYSEEIFENHEEVSSNQEYLETEQSLKENLSPQEEISEDKLSNHSDHTDQNTVTPEEEEEIENSIFPSPELSDEKSQQDLERTFTKETGSASEELKEAKSNEINSSPTPKHFDENNQYETAANSNHNEDALAKLPDVEHVDVKKRVLEILADANIPSPRGDKSPRLQDLYVTAYDITSSDNSPELGSPSDDCDQNFTPPQPMFGSDEVEELLKKQLAIEQEIKEIQQQQKEQLPYMYLREIPNKPPPPYTPPVSIQAPTDGSVLPNSEAQIGVITSAAAGILHRAYLSDNLQNVTLSTEDKRMLQTKSNVESSCFEFIFDLCKEAAIEHYKQFETETGPSWMHLNKKSKLALGKPLNRSGLEKCISKKVGQSLGYETVKSAENIKRKWCGKKRDHVDELLVVECQAEETEWTNYDRDELIVKDELVKEIMNMLLSETAQVFNSIVKKNTFLC